MKKQVILMSLAVAGLLCCILMFVLNGPGAPSLSGGAASLLGTAGAVLFGTCIGTLLQLKRLSRDPDYRQRQKARCDERNQAIRDRAGYLAGLLTLSLLVIAGWILQSFARLGVPEWVVRLLRGSGVFYLAAFFLLYKWFQRRM